MKKTLEGVHQEIYKYLKKKACALEGKPSPMLEQYRRDQHSCAKRPFSNSNISDLEKAIDRSHIIYLGDFHTFDQSTRNLERLIRILTSKRNKFTIGLEFVEAKFQSFINYYISGHISELEFLDAINYKESWRFPWTFYRKFFEMAKKESLSIIALNTKGSLKKRDENAAKILAKYHKENPDEKLLVLFGEYHIIKNKLPENFIKETKSKIKQVIIHQNLDSVYWRLIKKTKHVKDKVVRFNNDEFVLITSAPWLKYESQIYWYEHLSEDPEFDIHEYIIENGALNFSDNVPDNFAFICEELNKTFKLGIASRRIEDFTLLDHIKLSSLKKKLDKIKESNIRNFYLSLIKRGRSFRVPGTRSYFCSSYSINRISYLSGIHIHHVSLKKRKVDPNLILIGKNREATFMYFLFQAMCGYFASKFINPYRKCDMYSDLKILSNSSDVTVLKRGHIKRALLLLDRKNTIDESIKGLKLLSIFMMARALGHLYADILFDYYFVKGSSKFQVSFDLIFTQDFDQDSYNLLHKQILTDVNYKGLKKRIF